MVNGLNAIFSSVLEKKSVKKVKKDKDKKKDKNKRKKERKRKKKKEGRDKKEKKKRRIEEEQEEQEQNQNEQDQEGQLQQIDGYEIYEEGGEEEEEEEEDRQQSNQNRSSPVIKRKESLKRPTQPRKKAKNKNNEGVEQGEQQHRSKNWKWNAHNLDGQKYGQWSKTEETALQNALKTWCRKNGHLDMFTRKDYSFLLRDRNQDRGELDKALYYEISAEMKTRNPQQCYERVRRTFIRSAKGADERLNKKWSSEETMQLKSLVDMHGSNDWNEIGKRIGRDGQVCRDKYRNTFDIFDENRGEVKKGKFSTEEREKFREIMEEYYEEHGIELGNPEEGKHGDVLDDISWTVVAKKLGGNRTEKACYTHWKNVLAAGEKGDFMVENRTWGGFDEDVSLLEQVKKQCASDEMEELDLDFSLVFIPGRSQAQIVRRWKFLKQRTGTRKQKTLSEKIEKYETRVAKERKKAFKENIDR